MSRATTVRRSLLAGSSAAALALTGLVTAQPGLAAGGSFAQLSPITIGLDATVSPYPSTIGVSGLPKGITDVNVTLSGFDHTYPSDVDVLLVGPTGKFAVVVSDVGDGFGVSGVNLTIDDQAAGHLPTEQITSGTYQPTNFETDDDFPAPAPDTDTSDAVLSTFNGTDPNGSWSLYVADDYGAGDGGDISGWSLQITTIDLPAAPVFTAPVTEPSTDTDGSFSLAGTAPAGSTVKVFDGATQVGSLPATSGAWALALVDVPDGTHAYTATATDGLGNVSGPSAARTVTVDSVRPHVTRTRPAQAADDVRVGRNVRATFSEAVRPGTLTKANVRLVDTETGDAVRARRTYNATTHTVVINPRRDLAPDTRYRVVIGTGVKDVAGNRLDQKPRTGLQLKTWRFTTR